MVKVCFIYDGETNERYLEILKKMTPNRSGIWKNLIGVTKVSEADWCVVIDSTTQSVPLDRTLFMSAHPCIEGYESYKNHDDKPHKLDLKYTFGFGEWWINYDYDTLSNLEPITKTKQLCCILSNAEGRPDHYRRKKYMERFCDKHPIDLYGRIVPTGQMVKYYKGTLGVNASTTYWFGKEDVLKQYKYALEFDNGQCLHYFSERVFDDLLLWTMPIIAIGGTNIEEYLPKNCFRYVDISKDGDDVWDIVNSNFYDLEAISEARNLLLNKYQIWARTYEYINRLI